MNGYGSERENRPSSEQVIVFNSKRA